MSWKCATAARAIGVRVGRFVGIGCRSDSEWLREVDTVIEVDEDGPILIGAGVVVTIYRERLRDVSRPHIVVDATAASRRFGSVADAFRGADVC